KAGDDIQLGNFSVTPFLVDHSAYDSYMFLIKAEGKKILHTGDFRTHGFRGKGVLPMLRKYVGPVDVLIIEGTSLSNDGLPSVSESQLQHKAKELLSSYKYVFVICPSTNIDRIASFHEATPRGKYFLCDAYQKDIIEIARKHGGVHSSLYSFRKALVYNRFLEEKAERAGFCMMVRTSGRFLETLKKYRENHNSECLLIYSMWDGYLRQSGNVSQSLMDGFQNSIHLHTSGHATNQAIVEVCSTVRPTRAIIPIHTFSPAKFAGLGLPFHIEHLSDGQVFEVK
ncbi:MAG: MBL fold metallo-hydrolase, partial [Spirochaetae bacterium HGW-Spirochaetae-8]